MFEPKQEVYNILKGLVGVSVLQKFPKAFQQFPAITFSILENELNLTLENEIGTQRYIVQIDVWAEKSTECVNVLKQVESLMRSNYYTLRFSQDLHDPEGLYRITTRFSKKS